MIKSFKDKKANVIFSGVCPKGFPGNRLEALSGDRKGQYSIRINGQFRICFNWNKISQNKCARDIRVPPRRINEICLKKRSITADTAIRLGKYFSTTAQFWLSLQSDYDLEEVQ